MKTLLALAAVTLIAAISAKAEWVSGYVRSSGTYVQPYYRTPANGTPYDLTGKPAFSLCRCGASTNKPFCDGTHSKIGFQAAEAAVRAEDKV